MKTAHADIDPLRAADTDAQQQADAMIAEGQAVLDGAKAAAGHC